MISSHTIASTFNNRKYSPMIFIIVVILIIFNTNEKCYISSSQFTTTTTFTKRTLICSTSTSTYCRRNIIKYQQYCQPSTKKSLLSFQIRRKQRQRQRKRTQLQKLWKLHCDDISRIPVPENNNQHFRNLPLKQLDTSTTPIKTAIDLSNAKLSSSSSSTIQSTINNKNKYNNNNNNQRRSFLSQVATALVPLFAVGTITSSTYVNVAHAAATVDVDTTTIEPVLVPELETSTVKSTSEVPRKIILPTARNQTLVITIESKPNNTICSKIQSRTNDLLQFYYEAYIGNDEVSGVLYDSSYARGGGTYSYVLGSGDIIAGIDQGLYNMCLDEIRTINVPPVLGYSASGLKLYKIPQNTNVIWKIQLVSINFISSSDDRTRSDIE